MLAPEINAIGGIVTGVATVVDDLWVSEEEKLLATAAVTQANAQLASVQVQADANASASNLAAQNSKKQWQTIQYGLGGVAVLIVLFMAYKATQG